MQHLIKKQIIELGMAREADAFGLQQVVSEHYRGEVLQVFDQLFDECSKEEECLVIDRLEIDLGIVPVKDLLQNPWSPEILTGIREQLLRQINLSSNNNSIATESRPLNFCRQWLYYMENGNLPWNFVKKDEAWYEGVLKALATDMRAVSSLRNIILRHDEVVKRIVWQHDEIFLIKLIEILTAQNQDNLPKAVDKLHKMLNSIEHKKDSSITPGETRAFILEQIIGFAAEERTKLTWDQLIEKTILIHVQALSSLESQLPHVDSGYFTILPVLERLEKLPEMLKPMNTDAGKDKNGGGGDKPFENRDGDGIFVQNAGVVLIHPFLPQLFRRLKWIEDGKFINHSLQQKAMHLLHYISTGIIGAEEHELTVPKVLCNWPLKMPLLREVELREEVIAETDHMLQAAITQWTVLKSASIDGLREGFLQRKGKFFIKSDNQYLLVESHAIDVLLDQLPWNLSIIKLPWMNKILRVEWR